jgi:hypothetical protein
VSNSDPVIEALRSAYFADTDYIATLDRKIAETQHMLNRVAADRSSAATIAAALRAELLAKGVDPDADDEEAASE